MAPPPPPPPRTTDTPAPPRPAAAGTASTGTSRSAIRTTAPSFLIARLLHQGTHQGPSASLPRPTLYTTADPGHPVVQGIPGAREGQRLPRDLLRSIVRSLQHFGRAGH